MKESTCSLLLLLLSVFLFLFFCSTVSSAPSLKPVDILLNCGDPSNDVDADKRQWTNDSNALFAPPNSQSSFSALASNVDLSQLPSAVPYRTARIFTSASSYNFTALPSGRHFVRLHFFPAVYNDRDPKNAFFSVTTELYTLLSNFSPAITASVLNQAYIMREYFITVPSSGSLNLTFTPSPSNPNSFAFINGIEIVSSPELFLASASTVPTNQPFPIADSYALQTVVRLNVGGGYVPPNSSLSRTWHDDSLYILGAGFGVSYLRDNNVSIRYSKAVPDYIAPPDVYGTARSMGPNTSVNSNYNLTWLITVDSNFRYLIRLHFCEIQSEIFQPRQRVFNVYVNNMTAESGFDVIFNAKNEIQDSPYTGVAVYKDYMVVLPRSSDKQSDLQIELHPDLESNPYYADAILNGLEAFKINGQSGNLAGPNPDLPPAPPPENSSPVAPHGGGHSLAIAGAVGGTTAGLVVGACLCCLLCRCQRKKKKKEEKGSDGSWPVWLPLSPYAQEKNGKSTAFSAKKSQASLSNASNSYCRHFRFSEIVAATDNFSESLLLGSGGFGKVYKGDIDDGTKVAIKRGSELSHQGVHEFQNEIQMLSKLRHRHLVPLIGYCEDSSEMILVYEYMPHGTLREHLYGRKGSPLSWRQRVQICIGAAKGLHYLHTGAKHILIHRDVKSTNILIDENWVAKVSDFGISKMGSEMAGSHVTTDVKGTFGYVDPEYYRLQRLTEKSDVYSFGVVLFEVLTARPALDRSRPTLQVCLAEWALRCVRKGVIEQIVDPFLRGKIAHESLHKFVETAEMCLADRGVDRPTMANVLWNLEFALSLQTSAEEADEKGVVVSLGATWVIRNRRFLAGGTTPVTRLIG